MLSLALVVGCGDSSGGVGGGGGEDAGGQTGGCAAVCGTAPPSECADGATLKTWAAPDSCETGTPCSFVPSLRKCDFGCRDGACIGDSPADAGTSLCANVVCTTPPASVCKDANTLTASDPSGSCAGGSCLYPTHAIDCANGCANGGCIGDPCAGVTCGKPPAAVCIDATTLGKYAAQGSCAQGTCSYSQTRVTCPFGCANGACVGDPCSAITCNASPAAYCSDAVTLRSFANPGSCAAGSCTYATADTTCAFGCAQGACSGDPCAGKTCAQPPANVCVNGSTLRAFASAGSCAGGSCTYGHTDSACPFGCAGGVCQSDPCATLTCNAPPSSVCENGNARIYAANGTCGAGACSYPSTLVACANGCANGACNGVTCGATTCNTPPAAVCTSAKRLHTYARLGTCGAGNACSYATSETECSAGCFNGACVSGSWTTELMWPQPGSSQTYGRPRVEVDAAKFAHVAVCLGTAGFMDLAHISQSDYGWRTETVDPQIGTGCRVALALKAGQPAFAYYDSTNLDLRYAERTAAGAFVKELIANVGSVGKAPALAFDAAGTPWVGFLDETNGKYQVAHRGASGWILETLGTAAMSEPIAQLRFDSAGQLHAVYGEGNYVQNLTTRPSVMHAVRGANGVWQTTVVAKNGYATHRALSFTAAGETQILYGALNVHNTQELRWQRLLASGLRDELTSDAQFNASQNQPLPFLVDDQPAAPMIGRYQTQITRRDDNGLWQTVQTPISQYATLYDGTVGPDGRARFLGPAGPSYEWSIVTPPACVPVCSGRACGGDGCGGTCGSCAAGSACQPDGTCGAWRVETVDMPVNYSGGVAQLAVRASGEVDMVVLGSNATYLTNALYLTRSTSGWSSGVEIVSGQRMSTTHSFSLAPNGTPAIAYMTSDQQSPQLFTSQPGPSGWTPAMMTTQKPSHEPQLAIDGAGVKHLLWAASSLGNGFDLAYLRYANNASGAFQEVTVADTHVGLPSSQFSGSVSNYALAVDANGKAHIVWLRTFQSSSQTLVTLRYATNVSGAFTDEQIVDPGYSSTNAFPFAQIVADAAGSGHLLYPASGQVWHATRTSAGVWSKEQAQAGTLVLDPQGALAVIGTSSNKATIYRRQTNGTWTPEVLPLTPYGASALSFDAQGRPHVLSLEQRSDGGGSFWMRYAHRL
jgi:hypothetical protein